MSVVKEKKYQIVVTGQQHDTTALVPVAPHVYYVRAEDRDKARTRALTLFQKSFPGAVNVSAERDKNRNVAAIICIAIACLLSFVPWHMGNVIFSLSPSLFSTMIAVALYSAVIIRLKGLQNSFSCASETILTCLTILFCASFLSFFCGDTEIQVFKFVWFEKNITISGKVFLTIAVLLSWIGMAAIAGIVWIVLFVLAAARLLLGDAAMGFWGNIYVLTGFLGILFQLKQQSPDFLNALSRDMLSATARTRHRIVHDTGVLP